MPRGGLLNRLTRAVMLRDQSPRQQIAIHARGEAGLVLADQLLRGWRIGGELRWIQMPTAGNAVNVPLMLLTARAGRQVFAFAFGEALLSLHRGGT